MGLAFGLALMHALEDEGLTRSWSRGGSCVVFVARRRRWSGVLAAVFPARRAARLDVLRAITTE